METIEKLANYEHQCCDRSPSTKGWLVSDRWCRHSTNGFSGNPSGCQIWTILHLRGCKVFFLFFYLTHNVSVLSSSSIQLYGEQLVALVADMRLAMGESQIGHKVTIAANCQTTVDLWKKEDLHWFTLKFSNTTLFIYLHWSAVLPIAWVTTLISISKFRFRLCHCCQVTRF